MLARSCKEEFRGNSERVSLDKERISPVKDSCELLRDILLEMGGAGGAEEAAKKVKYKYTERETKGLVSRIRKK